jgi:hypothetical protein
MSAPVRAALAVLATSSACHGTTVVQAIKCPDPCCEGQAMSIDCAENPDLSCTEDADPCNARVYGCVDGSYYLGYPDVAPSSCAGDAGANGGVFVLGDGSAPNADAKAGE